MGHAFDFLTDGLFFLYSANQTWIHLDLHEGKADKADWAHLLSYFLQFLRNDSIFTKGRNAGIGESIWRQKTSASVIKLNRVDAHASQSNIQVDRTSFL